MRKRPLLVVEWKDISAYSGWSSEKEAEEYTPLACETTGWKMKGDRKNLRLASTRTETNKYTDIIVIPRGCIKSIQRLKQCQ
jgi:hypothetical protein